MEQERRGRVEDKPSAAWPSGVDLTRALANPLAFVGSRRDGVGSTINNEQALNGLITRVHDRCRELRKGHHPQWMLNLVNLLGYQNAKFNRNEFTVKTVNDADWRVRHVVNMAGMATQRVLAKILRLIPRPEVIPISTDYKHTRAARMAEKYLMAKVEQFGLERTLTEMLLKVLIHSKAYLKVCWDTQAGESYMDDDGEAFFEGDLSMSVDTPLTLFHEPGVNTIDEATWALQALVKTRGWVYDRYPDLAERLERANSQATQPVVTELDQVYSAIEGVPRADADNCLVREFWLRPQRTAKDEWRRQGVWLVMVDDKIAAGPEPFPYENGKLPWVEMDDAFMQGIGNFGPTLIAQWLTSNHVYNNLTSMALEHLRLCARPKILVVKGMGISKSSLTSQPGEVIEFNHDGVSNQEPKYMRGPDLNQGAYESMANRQLADFDNMTGQHEVSRGISPGAASPAAAIEQLIQADDTVLRPLAGRWRLFLTEVFRRHLELERQFGEERDLVVYGVSESAPRSMKFSGASLEYRDVRIEPNSLKPTSPIAQREQIYRLAQVGLLGPFQSPEHEAWAKKVLSTMEWGDASAIFQEANKDSDRAEWENDQLDDIQETVDQFDQDLQRYVQIPLLGSLIPQPYDNHATHIEKHESRQKDPSFLYLPRAAQRAHLFHVELHKNALVEGTQQPDQIKASLTSAGVLKPTSPQEAQMGDPNMNQAAAEVQLQQQMAQAQAQAQAQIPQGAQAPVEEPEAVPPGAQIV